MTAKHRKSKAIRVSNEDNTESKVIYLFIWKFLRSDRARLKGTGIQAQPGVFSKFLSYWCVLVQTRVFSPGLGGSSATCPGPLPEPALPGACSNNTCDRSTSPQSSSESHGPERCLPSTLPAAAGVSARGEQRVTGPETPFCFSASGFPDLASAVPSPGRGVPSQLVLNNLELSHELSHTLTLITHL